MKRKPFARVQAAVTLAIFMTFWAALALMPWDLAHFDEVHVLWQASTYGWLEIAHNLMRDSHPPLYYWLVRGWMEVGGFNHPWTFRVLSLMLGLPALPLAFQIGRRLEGPRLGLALIVLLMLNPFYLFQLILIRMYSFAIALGAWLTLFWLRLLERPSRSRWAIWSIAQVVLLFTHYYGLFLIIAQWLVLLVRRPRGWRLALMICAGFFGAFLAWIAQAYQSTMEHTVRQLTAIPVSPLPWEVIFHFWANGLVGPLADGWFARGVAFAMGILLLVSSLIYPPVRVGSLVIELVVIVLLSLALGAVMVLRWPFFAARYFAMSFVPTLALIAWLLARSWHRWMFPLLLFPGLIGLSGFPVLSGHHLNLEGEYKGYIQALSAPSPVLVQASWHSFAPDRWGFQIYEWPDPAQRAAVMDRFSSFWFIGVSIYRADWEGWVKDLQRTHILDSRADFNHPILEHQASVLHFVRRLPVSHWVDLTARWENGIRLLQVGRVRETARPGDSAQWLLRFSIERPVDRRWTLFVHLVDEAGRLWANWDAEPDPPTDRWEPERTYEIARSLLIPLFVPPGRYQVYIGWYETGTPGFPRLPLAEEGGDTVRIGELVVEPQGRPWRMGTRIVDPVALEPPEVRVRPGPEGARITVAFWWQGRKPAAFAGWQVVWRGSEGTVPLQRLYPIPEGATLASGWVYEVWTSPPIPGGRPALGWLEIQYAGQLLARRPIWIFPASVSWSYDWLFLNRINP